MICCMISAANGGKAKLDDFMLKFGAEVKKQQTPEEMQFVLRCFTQAFNAGQC